MERREAIKNLGVSFGAFVATPTALSFLQSCGPTMEAWTPTFLSEDQGKMLRKVVDGILPGVDDMPSATAANVHVFIDKFLDEVMAIEDRDNVMNSLEALYSDLLATAEAEDYEDVSAEQVNAYLDSNLKKSEEELEAFQKKVGELYQAETKPADFPDDVKVGSVLGNIRDMCIWAYKNNENVGKNVLAYDPIPGDYIGCADLQEISGGKIWAE